MQRLQLVLLGGTSTPELQQLLGKFRSGGDIRDLVAEQ